ncbi:uncharacterized protein N7506_010609 [Penicillium brevicompactum]|uniref:uncharacterized protein n=1 Tax=Penicillium brevicompactum TaxID=5074 RepID=UPI00253FCEA7|nr:uncharacterized protein N7506_010609 [Penicillium brevicompactum]KAJ5327507.1 hypothetical protein N7506_010609 [Penicillium brevicompactum]
MAAGKKAKSKAKGKAANKQEVKKGKTPENADQTTTETPAPGSPELLAQDSEGKDQPSTDTPVDASTPLPVSAYEVTDDNAAPQDIPGAAENQEAPAADKPASPLPVSAYEVFDDDTAPQDIAIPATNPASPVIEKPASPLPVSAYEVFDDETTPQDVSGTAENQELPTIEKPASPLPLTTDEPLDATAPQDIPEPVVEPSSPVIEKPASPVPESSHETSQEEAQPQTPLDSTTEPQPPVTEETTEEKATSPVDEAVPLEEPSLTQPPVQDTEPKELLDEASLTTPAVEDIEPKEPLDEASLNTPAVEDIEPKEPLDEANLNTPAVEDIEPKESLDEASLVQPPTTDSKARIKTTSQNTLRIGIWHHQPPADPFSPVAASVPLPSPSLTESRYMTSPSQDNQLYNPEQSAYSPYASPIPYPAPLPYGSPNPYASPVPYAASAYGSPNPYSVPLPESPVPYSSGSPYAGSPVPYTSPIPYNPAAAYAGSPVPYSLPGPYNSAPPYAGSPVPYTLPAPYAGSPYASPAPYASPIPYTASPVPKVSSPLARSHYPQMSPTMSPTATPPPHIPSMAQMAPPPPPSTAPSVPTAVNSPVMSSAGAIPPYGSYSPRYSPEAHQMHRSYSIPDPAYAASYQALQNLSMGGPIPENGLVSPPDADAEHIELLHRIQSAIPDINRLLHGFRNTHSKLSNREAEMKQIGNQHEQALMHKEFYIEALQAQMKKTASESAADAAQLKNTVNELRLELGNLQEKQKDLEDGIAVHQKSNEELTQSKAELEGQINELNDSIKAAQEAHEKELETHKEEQEKALGVQKQELTELFEEIKNEDEKAATEALQAREKELLDEHEANKGEWEKEKSEMQTSFEAQRAELETAKAELASKITELEAELEARLAELNSAREELATKLAELETARTELEDAHKKHGEEFDLSKTGHASELDALRQSHDDQIAAAAKALDDKIATLEATLNDKQQLWTTERGDLEKQLSEKDSELSSAEREKEKLEGDGIVKEQHLQRAVEGMKLTIENLGSDCDRLRKTLLSLGEATDLRNTKGDKFFMDSFTELSRLIYDLSKEHFGYLPIDPPKDILSKIPSELPPFLDNTPASRELRSVYIQHVVSKTITYRVFQPFLFTLGRRYDKADTFFQMLSMDIRKKSVRREAFWRQQTLKAAYTTSDAKQSINVAAAVIVDEIIDHIKHFADPKHLDLLLTSVRKIVKLAAETWRHARVERELVLATFPAPDADTVVNEEWTEYAANKDAKVANGEPTRHVVLRTFPRIIREAAHEDFATEEERANNCIYAPGIVLYSDSPAIMGRLQEVAKKSSDGLDGQKSPTKLSNKPIEKIAPLKISTPRVVTVRSAPTSPGPKGPFTKA